MSQIASQIDAVQAAQARRRGITWRSVLLGAATAIALNVYTNHAGLVMGSSSLVKAQFPMSVLLPFALWLFLNVGLRAFYPKVALSSVELLVIYSMSWIAGVIPMEGWAAYWTNTVAVPIYYASPENRWQEVIFGSLPWWTLPQSAPGIIRPFHEGLLPGEALPWIGWIQPLFWWTAISMAMLIAGICLCVLFRRQWEDAERLTFPLSQFAVALTEGFDGPDRVPGIFKNKLFWAGFFVVFAVFLWNIIGYFAIGLPEITIYAGYRTKEVILGQHFPSIYLRILPPVVGLTYFCNLDILLSFWVLRLFAIFKLGIMDRAGYSIGRAGQQAQSAEIVNLESHGAMVMLALWSIWVARGHLKRVWFLVLRPQPEDREAFSYRIALLGFLAATVFIVGWMSAVGMSLPIALLHTALIYAAYLTVAKFTAASGFPHLFPPMGKGGGMVQTMVGTARLEPGDFVGIGLVNSSAFFGNTRIPAWPALPHHFKLLGDKGWKTAGLSNMAMLAFAAGLLASFLFVIHLAYTHGGQNLGTSPFSSQGSSVRTYDVMTAAISQMDRTVFDPAKMAVWLSGAGLTVLLILLRNRVPWWPLHPLGLAFQNTAGPIYYAFSIFLTWSAKSLLLRIGGIDLYRRAAPFFIGLTLGYVSGLAVSSLVDMIWFPDGGHWVHGW